MASLPVDSSEAPQACLLAPTSACAGCTLNTQLKCRFKRADLLHFLMLAFGFMLPAAIGLATIGRSWR